MSLDEEDLAREFSGAVRLTVHVQEEVTLTPEQASPAQLPFPRPDALPFLLSHWLGRRNFGGKGSNLEAGHGQAIAHFATDYREG